MASTTRTVDLLTSAFDLTERRKFEVKNEAGEPILDLYFRPITRSDRKAAQARSKTEDPLELSTNLLCQKAELEDGSKAFGQGDAVRLQRELPESVLNEIELFLFGLGEGENLEESKKD